MKTHVFGILSRGQNADNPDLNLDELQTQHLKHIKAMKRSGILALAGPFKEDGDKRGIFIFNTDSVENAKKIAEEDPSVKVGRIKIEYLTLLVPPNTNIQMGEVPI